jgi:uncharacterized protein involved in exopolysaccharide biosynthesis
MRDRTDVPPAMDEDDLDDARRAAGPPLSVKQLLHIVLRRKWLILSCFALSIGITKFIGEWIVQPVYVATSQILVTPGREHVSDLTLPTGGAVSPWVRFNQEEEIQRTIELLTGRVLAGRVVRSLGADALYPHAPRSEHGWWRLVRHAERDDPMRREANAIDRFLRDLSAEPAGRSSIINLNFKHADPEMAASAVNRITEMYLERYLGVQKNPNADAFFEEQFRVLTRKLRDSEERLLAFKQRHRITGSVAEEQVLLRQMQTTLRGDLNATRGKQAELAQRAAELQQQMRERGTLYGNLQGELLRSAAEQRALQGGEAALVRRIGELQGQLDALERIDDEYGHLEKQVKADQDSHRLYLEKFEEARIAGAMDRERIVGVRVIEQAHVPNAPADSKLGRLLPLIPPFGLVGGLCLAVLLHLVRGTVDTRLDVERSLRLPVLASIPPN